MKNKIKNWLIFLGGGILFIFLNHLIVKINGFKKMFYVVGLSMAHTVL